MSKRGVVILAIVGVVLFVASLLGWMAFRQARDMAISIDSGDLDQPQGEGPGCRDLVALVTLDQRVMTVNESQALVVTLSLPVDSGCTVNVALFAPDFILAPPDTTQVVTIPAGEEVDVAWVISPREIGTYELVIVVDNASEVLGVTVTNTLGFTAVQAQILSIIGTFLGPMLTAPWWYDRWKERQKEKKAAAKKEAAEEKPQPGGRTIPFE